MAPFFSPLAALVGGSVAMILKRYFRRLNLLKVYLGNAAKKGTKIFTTENFVSKTRSQELCFNSVVPTGTLAV